LGLRSSAMAEINAFRKAVGRELVTVRSWEGAAFPAQNPRWLPTQHRAGGGARPADRGVSICRVTDQEASLGQPATPGRNPDQRAGSTPSRSAEMCCCIVGKRCIRRSDLNSKPDDAVTTYFLELRVVHHVRKAMHNCTAKGSATTPSKTRPSQFRCIRVPSDFARLASW
jgi:hypothetical protein